MQIPNTNNNKSQVVASLNNQAVRSLQQQDYRRSVETCLLALGRQKEALNKSRPQQQALISEDEELKPTQTQTASLDQSNSFVVCQPLTRNENTVLSSEDHQPLHLFDRVFLLSQRQDTTAVSHKDGTSAVILYNMAMAHHLKGIRFQQRIQLAKAVRIYQWALSSLQQWEKTTVNSSCCRHVLRLAILNNMAHANYCGNRTQDAIQGLKCLRDILGYAKAHVQSEDFAFFSGNLVASLCQTSGGLVSIPAAAA